MPLEPREDTQVERHSQVDPEDDPMVAVLTEDDGRETGMRFGWSDEVVGPPLEIIEAWQDQEVGGEIHRVSLWNPFALEETLVEAGMEIVLEQTRDPEWR